MYIMKTKHVLLIIAVVIIFFAIFAMSCNNETFNPDLHVRSCQPTDGNWENTECCREPNFKLPPPDYEGEGSEKLIQILKERGLWTDQLQIEFDDATKGGTLENIISKFMNILKENDGATEYYYTCDNPPLAWEVTGVADPEQLKNADPNTKKKVDLYNIKQCLDTSCYFIQTNSNPNLFPNMPGIPNDLKEEDPQVNTAANLAFRLEKSKNWVRKAKCLAAMWCNNKDKDYFKGFKTPIDYIIEKTKFDFKNPSLFDIDTSSGIVSGIDSCTPENGIWTKDYKWAGRSVLNSPCCQPPDYSLPASYPSCDNPSAAPLDVQGCLSSCCAYASSQRRNFDRSWLPMARCGCSLWCMNRQIPHFRKYGSAVSYLSGEPSISQTDDYVDYIPYPI